MKGDQKLSFKMDLALSSLEVLENQKELGNMVCTKNAQLPMHSDKVCSAKKVSPHFSKKCICKSEEKHFLPSVDDIIL